MIFPNKNIFPACVTIQICFRSYQYREFSAQCCGSGTAHANGMEVITMNDRQILALLQRRDESALAALTAAYRPMGLRIARNILQSDEDAEEVWNDALLNLWNAVPPAEPDDLGAYLHTAVRHLALKRLEKRQARKRGGGRAETSLDALPEHRHPASGGKTVEELMEARMLEEAVNRFLSTLPEETLTIFVHHYGNHRSFTEIAKAFGISRSKVAVTLMRVRKKLRQYLNEEGWL